jgi:hypothetical protein
MTEKINVERVVKEMIKGDLHERAKVIQFLVDWLAKEIDDRQQALAEIKSSLK